MIYSLILTAVLSSGQVGQEVLQSNLTQGQCRELLQLTLPIAQEEMYKFNNEDRKYKINEITLTCHPVDRFYI